jgi:signal transduction histidine kinase
LRFHKAHDGHFNKFLENSGKREMGIGRDLYGVRKNGEQIPVEAGLNPFLLHNYKYVMALVTDITVRKQQENQILELNENLEEKIKQRTLILRKAVTDLKKEVKTKYDSFLIELQTIEKEIREVSHKLNEDFDDSKTDFISLIQQLLDQNSKIGNFKNELIQNDEINWNNIDEITKVNLYKIIQESIFNIIKHSEANNVIIKFRFSNGHLNLSIIDNGFGFKQKRKPKGIGLKNIKSRIEKLDGSYEILSEKGEGTKILIHIPIK